MQWTIAQLSPKPQWVNADRAQFVWSSGGSLAIVVRTLFRMYCPSITVRICPFGDALAHIQSLYWWHFEMMMMMMMMSKFVSVTQAKSNVHRSRNLLHIFLFQRLVACPSLISNLIHSMFNFNFNFIIRLILPILKFLKKVSILNYLLGRQCYSISV